uniref:Uncharacterized protein n=1 Tax=Trichogramma kaykai TaxID=54128 RepID=A0ABD2W301_9HYME
MKETEITTEQYKLRLQVWRDTIPIYSGGNTYLSNFINQVDSFTTHLATSDAVLNAGIFAQVKTKIRGEALDVIVAEKPQTWVECRQLLIKRFSDPSSEQILYTKLFTCSQLANQNYENYADEIKTRLNKLKEYLQINLTDKNMIKMKSDFYDEICKNTFINGVKEPYHTYLINFETNNNEECLAKCHVYDNHHRQFTFLTFMSNQESRDSRMKGNNVNVSSRTQSKNKIISQPMTYNFIPTPYMNTNSNYNLTQLRPNFLSFPNTSGNNFPSFPNTCHVLRDLL